MSRIQKTKKIQGNTPRKCSVCCIEGHTKRACPTTKQSHTPAKPSHKASFVFVNAHAKAPTSAHIIDLKNKNEKNVWEHVTAFDETTSQRIKRISVNFAELVRNANAKKKVEHPNISAFRKALEQKSELKNSVYRIKKAKRASITHRISNRGTLVAEFFITLCNRGKVSLTSSTKKLSVKRLLPVAVLLSFALILPFPALSYYKKVSNDTSYIVERSTNAFLSLQSSTVAAFSNNIVQAQFDLNEALNGFSEAQMLIDKEYKALTYVAGMLPVVGKRIESRQDILVAGHHIALGNTYLVKGLDEATKDSSVSNTERLSILKSHIKSALPQYKAALESIASISPSALPPEYQQSFVDFRLLYATFIDDMEDLVSVIDGLGLALGSNDFRRYLIMFQNNHEIRATGGFTGSYAVLDVQKGKILNIEVPGGGTYDVQGQLDVYLRPPLPLQLANKRWEFQDVNWFPDFPVSARKTSEFYQYARGTSVDGVIAINASVLERLLRVMGPVYNSEHEVLLNADDALTDLQREVEIDYDTQKNEPKAVLSSLLEQMIKGIRDVNPKQLLALVAETHEALEQKEIQTYFADEQTQSKFRSFGWTGEMQKTALNQDYLMVVNSNIGGEKSDARLLEHVEHQAVVQGDGSIIDTVIIKREHSGNPDELFYGKKNINFVRVYVPSGSKLLDAGGFSFPEEESFSVPEYWYKDDPDVAAITQTETIHVGTGTQISQESGKTVFGNWVVTEPGKTSEIYFSYKLPFSIFDIEQSKIEQIPLLQKVLSQGGEPHKKTTSHYSFVMQKQSGVQADLISQIIYPTGWQPVWRTDDTVRVTLNGGELETDLDEDVSFGLVMEYHKNAQ